MVQVPAPTRVTVSPPTVHTDAVVELNVTGLPEAPPVAATVNGASPYTLPDSGPNEMTCATLIATSRVTVTSA